MGMVNFPIDTYNSKVSDHGVSRKQFAKDTGNPVAYRKIDAITGNVLGTDGIVSKIVTEYGAVEVADHEIETLFSITPDTIKVLEFEPQHLFAMGHYVPKGLLYVTPGRSEVGKKKQVLSGTLEAYSIFMAAMRVRGLMAVVEFTNRGTPKPGILLPNGNLWLIHHTDEIREPMSPDLMDIPDEIANAAADQFFAGQISTDVRDLTDERTALILGFADDKAKAGNFGAAPAPVVTAPAAPVGGLMAALQASVDAAKQQQQAM
jgi:non-homologous end joining protein Ku